jgi:hypothetical protein
MYLTPKHYRVWSVALLAVGVLGGCSTSRQDNYLMKHGWTPRFEERVDRMVRPSQHRFDPVMADPLPDEATALRSWETQSYVYPTGQVVAFPTYNPNYEDRYSWLRKDYLYATIQPFILLADAALLPFWEGVEPPLTNVSYHGSRLPPSMTVAPPLPRE